ncbi:hypothetical protein ACOSZC_19705 [Marinobacter salsuginis]
MAICFIVDRENPREPDILGPIAHLPLTVADAQKNIVFDMAAPADGWTQLLLEAATAHLEFSELDAFLGAEWVGSTEV